MHSTQSSYWRGTQSGMKPDKGNLLVDGQTIFLGLKKEKSFYRAPGYVLSAIIPYYFVFTLVIFNNWPGTLYFLTQLNHMTGTEAHG